MAGVPFTQRRGFPGFHQPLAGVLAQRLQESIAHHAVAVILSDHQRGADQALKQVEHVVPLDAVATRDRLGVLERPATGKHRQPVEQAALGVRQQVVAPIERRLQRALTRQGTTTTARQQPKPSVESCRKLPHRKRLDPPRRQLQGERNTVQPLADLGDGGGISVGEREARLHRQGTVDEQPYGGVVLELGNRGGLPGVGQRQ